MEINIRAAVAILMSIAIGAPPVSAVEFIDTQSHWAKKEIDEFSDMGVVFGYADNTFKPNEFMTRGEFAMYIQNIFGLPPYSAEKKYTDVGAYEPRSYAIYAVAAEGIMNDYGTEFRPNQLISREEAMYAIANAYEIDTSNMAAMFVDSHMISEWAKKSVNAMISNGYISGFPDGTMRPWTNITRAEFITMVSKVSEKIINRPGEYVEGYVDSSVVINCTNVTLKNTTIRGNLYINEGIGAGDVTLEGVTVLGTVFINGGGDKPIVLKNCKMAEMVVDKYDGNVNITGDANTKITNLQFKSAGTVAGEIKVRDALVEAKGVKIGFVPNWIAITAESVSMKNNEYTEKEAREYARDYSSEWEEWITEVLQKQPMLPKELQDELQMARITEHNTYLEHKSIIGDKPQVVVSSSSSNSSNNSGSSSKEKVKRPYTDIDEGNYTGTQTVELKTSTSGAQIYYTTDGTTPTTSSKKYTGPITVSTTTTLKAIATKSGMEASSVMTAEYVISIAKAEMPKVSIAAGEYTTAQSIELSTATADAQIYYTTDGTTPTASSKKYTGPITVSITTTLKAIATKSGMEASAVMTAEYVISIAKAEMPKVSIAAGEYTTAQSIELSTATADAQIYYTTDGTTPTTSSKKYTGPITVSTTTMLKAIATKSGMEASSVMTAEYVISIAKAEMPKVSIAAGEYTTAQSVELSTATADAQIYYTTDGTTPTASSKKYTGPITVSTTTTLKAIATKSGMEASAVMTAEYVITDAKWKLVWADEFDGEKVDASKWAFQIGTAAENGGPANWGNNELQFYTEENTQVVNGELVITAKKEAKDGMSYTSSRLWTNPAAQENTAAEFEGFSNLYGRIEAAITLPAGDGMWPAFWMLPATDEYGTWASGGEIDIVEARGREPHKVDGTIHYGGSWPKNKYSGGHYTFPNGEDLSTKHVYAIEWHPEEINWYVDGNLYHTETEWYTEAIDPATGEAYKFPAPFDKEFYILLNLAVGGNYDGGTRPGEDFTAAEMKVDYVRVYEIGEGFEKPAAPKIESVANQGDTKAITFEAPADGATIYYTTDGTKPTEDNYLDIATAYEEPIVIVEDTVISAIAVSAKGVASKAMVEAVRFDTAETGNLVENGDFFAPTEGNWHTWKSTNDSVHPPAPVVAGEMVLEIDNTKAGEFWHTQLFQEGIDVAAGKKYTLTFDAKSSEARPIKVEGTFNRNNLRCGRC
ncbi:chitobiase/beta-hexosaminidase C-terminal domain-containing protein [Candidatus Epulonipiscium viviparus]|uniref:chitobiase/beta-hexosaminidase C-terminal domain-containing protein n=1 Tax=Candidatus Epulonipiscium viviparus TaxID=420336 RepID=UPI0027380A65|nr:chitobiase/beta-hexosaminidase C-terminal domain-containing protein [Candidatus Epulopiscium viviparus]